MSDELCKQIESLFDTWEYEINRFEDSRLPGAFAMDGTYNFR